MSKNLYHCEWCGKEIYSWPSVKRCRHIFCDLRCRGKWFGTYRNIARTNKVREKLRVGKIGAKNPNFGQRDEKSIFWLGDDVGYGRLHSWIKEKLGSPDTCAECRKAGLSKYQIHWANISGNYFRKLSDWVRLCAKCHKGYDRGNMELSCLKF